MLNRVWWLLIAVTPFLAGPAAAQTGTLDRIRTSGVITMGYLENSAPFSFLDESR